MDITMLAFLAVIKSICVNFPHIATCVVIDIDSKHRRLCDIWNIGQGTGKRSLYTKVDTRYLYDLCAFWKILIEVCEPQQL